MSPHKTYEALLDYFKEYVPYYRGWVNESLVELLDVCIKDGMYVVEWYISNIEAQDLEQVNVTLNAKGTTSYEMGVYKDGIRVSYLLQNKDLFNERSLRSKKDNPPIEIIGGTSRLGRWIFYESMPAFKERLQKQQSALEEAVYSVQNQN